MREVKTAAAILATAALTGPALAGNVIDPVVEPAPMPPAPAAYDWTGAYVGASLGYGRWTASQGGGSTSDEGLSYSAFAGYNRQMGDIVAGAEAEFGMADIMRGRGSLENMARLKGRLGFAQDNLLIYGVGGAAYANFDLGDDWGWLIGAGVEMGLGNNWVAGVEVTHSRFDDFSNTGGNDQFNAVSARAAYRF